MSEKAKAGKIEAFQDFAKGGYVEADKKINETGNREAAVAMDEEAKRKLQEADDEMAAALFGDINLTDTGTNAPKQTQSPKKQEGMTLVGRSPDGKRGIWKGRYDPTAKSDDGGKESNGFEMSLLD